MAVPKKGKDDPCAKTKRDSREARRILLQDMRYRPKVIPNKKRQIINEGSTKDSF